MTHNEAAQWVNNNLDSESAKVLMMFVDYLYENNFTFDGEKFNYLGQDAGIIHIYARNDWWIYLIHEVFEHEKFPLNEDLTAFMQSQAKHNTWCGGNCENCKTPEEFVLFGKPFDNLCKSVRVAFGRFDTEKVKTINPELCFTAERMTTALKIMDTCKRIIEYKNH
ncbi:MAG: hypothetical protein FWD90_04765 [Defluviitaleaceae bacterium]|nr:hypothetical protein [Defluviitaleaceae bacterium]